MLISTILISKINPASYNPRKDLQPGDAEYEKLKKSITEFDLVEPLIWNKKTGNLVGGHQRLKILKELGHKEVEVSVVDLDEVKEKALNLALNKISGEWDYPSLKDLLEEINTGDFDIEITGFDEKEIEDLMTQFHVLEEGLTDDDAIPDAPESLCKRGDLWQLGNHRLLCGDATKKEDVERLMGGEKADMVFTDPPYGVGYEQGKFNKFQTRKEGEFPPIENDEKRTVELKLWLDKIFPIIFNACNDSSAIYVFSAPLQEGTVMLNSCMDAGFHVQSQLVWIKDIPAPSRSDYHWQHEIFWYGYKGKNHYWHGGDNASTSWEIRSIQSAGSRDDKGNLWFAGGSGGLHLHPTQKPVALAERAISNSSQLENIILDLFGGSGSTLIACEKLGRRCYMMEIDEHYCDVIVKRWEDFTGKKATLINGD